MGLICFKVCVNPDKPSFSV